MVTASNGSQTVTRNSSQFKVIPKNIAESQENYEKKDEGKTPGMEQNPPDTKEDIPLRRSTRQINSSCQILRLCTSHLCQIGWSKELV